MADGIATLCTAHWREQGETKKKTHGAISPPVNDGVLVCKITYSARGVHRWEHNDPSEWHHSHSSVGTHPHLAEGHTKVQGSPVVRPLLPPSVLLPQS